MRDKRMGLTRKKRLAIHLPALLIAAGVAGYRDARADEPPPPPPPPPPLAAPAPEMPPPPPPAAAMPVPPPPPSPPSAVEAAPSPPTSTEAMPATRPETLPPIDVGAWARVGGIFQNGTDRKKLDDFHMDNAYVELHAGGKIHKNVGVTLNLNSNITDFADPEATTAAGQIGSVVRVMDVIVSFDFMDEFHVWAGHLLVPVDRSNFSGPFFMIPWRYPGLTGAYPKEGPAGRNNGAVIWGDVAPAKLTYALGVFDNALVGSSPLFSGRLRLALWDPETGFWGNGSYFGEKDLLTIGVGGQFQKHGGTTTDDPTDEDYYEVNADLLVEKKIPGGGWVTGEGAYYHFNTNDGGVSDSFFVLAAYASPTVGVGNIQPMVRYQWQKGRGTGAPKPWNVDVGVSYLIKGPALRVVATYSYTKLDVNDASGTALSSNSIQLGAQAIFF